MVEVAEAHAAMVACINARDWDGLRALAHPDFAYTGPNGAEEAGGPELMATLPLVMVEAFDVRYRVVAVHVVGAISIAELHATGRHVGEFAGIAPTGEAVEAHIADIIEVRDGLIYREREYFDRLGILAVIGAVRAAG